MFKRCFLCISILMCILSLSACTQKQETPETSAAEKVAVEKTVQKKTEEPEKDLPTSTLEEIPEERTWTEQILPFDVKKSFTYSTGFAGWFSSVDLYPDGVFSGHYQDANGAEMYICDFEGSFKNVEKVDEYTYRLHFNELDITTEHNESWTEGPITYIPADSHGFDQSQTILLYLPGKDVTGMPEDFMFWYNAKIGKDENNKNTELDCYTLHNPVTDAAFFCYD